MNGLGNTMIRLTSFLLFMSGMSIPEIRYGYLDQAPNPQESGYAGFFSPIPRRLNLWYPPLKWKYHPPQKPLICQVRAWPQLQIPAINLNLQTFTDMVWIFTLPRYVRLVCSNRCTTIYCVSQIHKKYATMYSNHLLAVFWLGSFCLFGNRWQKINEGGRNSGFIEKC